MCLFSVPFGPMQFSTDRINSESNTCLARPTHNAPKSCLPGLILNDDQFPLLTTYPLQSIPTKYTHKQAKSEPAGTQNVSYLFALITALCSTSVHHYNTTLTPAITITSMQRYKVTAA